MAKYFSCKGESEMCKAMAHTIIYIRLSLPSCLKASHKANKMCVFMIFSTYFAKTDHFFTFYFVFTSLCVRACVSPSLLRSHSCGTDNIHGHDFSNVEVSSNRRILMKLW